MNLSELLSLLSQRLTDDELRTICFRIRYQYAQRYPLLATLEYENLGGEGKAGKVRSLLEFLARRECIPLLLEALQSQRPDLSAATSSAAGYSAPQRTSQPAIRAEDVLRQLAQEDGAHQELNEHYRAVMSALRYGQFVPFLGEDVNLYGRPPGIPWEPGRFLPSQVEVATYLAKTFGYPTGHPLTLRRVSQYIATMHGPAPLNYELHTLFDTDYAPTPFHLFFASLPGFLRAHDLPRAAKPHLRRYVVVTTNYDDALERAFMQVGEPFHVLTYLAESEDQQIQGRFCHWLPGGSARIIESPNEYRGFLTDDDPVIIKLHGAVDRVGTTQESFVVTEDHYIHYAGQRDAALLIPAPLPVKLKNSGVLFMGFHLREWNLRAIMHRVWGDRPSRTRSWAVQMQPDALERELWKQHHVDLVDRSLEDYLAGLSAGILRLAATEDAP